MLEQEELCKNAIKKGRLNVVKRPVLIAIIGYIIGIIMGLYFNFSIALFYIPIIVIYFFKKTLKISKKEFKLISLNIENPANAIITTTRPMKVIVPALGNTTGGSVSCNWGETSDVFSCFLSLKSVYFISTFLFVLIIIQR